MRLTVRFFMVCTLAIWLTLSARSQEFPRPGPEHEMLKQLEGTWHATIKAGGQESKGTVTYKMGMGGLWLLSHFEGDFGGQAFEGRRMETYDTSKKKYVSVWADSMSTTPLIMEGDYEKDKKILTMTGEGPSPAGTVKYKTVLRMVDADSMEFTISHPDGKEGELFAISYKRKK